MFLRVPRAEWSAVTVGAKREFRAACGKHSALWSVRFPTPAVAYTIDAFGRYDSSMMVLDDVWREPLGAISAASLVAEGYESIAEFRRHWMAREHRRFPPLRMTAVYRIRPWTLDDNTEMADAILRRLYGEFLPPRCGSAPKAGDSSDVVSRRLGPTNAEFPHDAATGVILADDGPC